MELSRWTSLELKSFVIAVFVAVGQEIRSTPVVNFLHLLLH
jgi:hypothetical protein